MKCPIMRHFIGVLTVCHKTHLGVTTTEGLNPLPADDLCLSGCFVGPDQDPNR